MTTANFCNQCGSRISTGSHFCPKCGASIEPGQGSKASANQSVIVLEKSEKSGLVVFLLCLFFGMLGIHRFYVGKIGTGILMLLTGGGFGIWVIVDLCLIICNAFTDKMGRVVTFITSPSTAKKVLLIIGVLLLEFILLITTIICIAFYATSGLSMVVNEQLTALRAGDIEKAYSYTAKDFRDAVSINQFERFINQYPSLKNNESASFSKREIENNMGTLKGSLKSKDGAVTPIEYHLIKEGGTWKILYILVNPTGTGVEIDHKKSSDTSSLPNTYRDKNNKYEINYPADWEFVKPDPATVVISGKKGTPAYYSTVNIQTILTKKMGGRYNTVDELMDSLKKQAENQLTDVKILSENTIELPASSLRKKMQGRYLMLSYKYKGENLQQLQFVFERDDGQVFYTWGYTAPADRYDTDYPIAKAMFSTWSID